MARQPMSPSQVRTLLSIKLRKCAHERLQAQQYICTVPLDLDTFVPENLLRASLSLTLDLGKLHCAS